MIRYPEPRADMTTNPASSAMVVEPLPDEERQAQERADREQRQEERRQQVARWWYQCQMAQADNRAQMALDEDYVDHEQWTEEDKAILAERGQAPLVFNLIATTIRWITGTEKRTRVDYRVLPRRNEGKDDAEIKTQLLKYVADVNRGAFKRSDAFQEAVSAGVGWLEEGIRGDSEDEPLFVRAESWRNIWYDPLSIERDLSDCRYLFRAKWIDLDLAQAMFPHVTNELAVVAQEWTSGGSLTSDPWDALDNPLLHMSTSMALGNDSRTIMSRLRVRLVECWYRVPENAQTVRGDGHEPWHGSIYRADDQVQQWLLDNGYASLYDGLKLTMRQMIFADSPRSATPTLAVVCQDTLSPYWHNKFPFTPVWAYRRKKDNQPYGEVRGLRDPQDDLNKRRSKALHLLATNQIIGEEGSVADWNEAITEAQRPDGVVRLTNAGKKFEIRNQATLAQSHIAMMDQSARYIQSVAGVTDENLGRQTNAISGRAIESRQNQGYTTTADLFDNLRLAIQISGEKQLALIEQFYDQDKVIRIVGERGQVEFKSINQDGNSITAMAADFVVDEQDFRQTIRQAMFETILEMVPKIPDPATGMKILTLAFEMSDLPLRDEFVGILREATGMQAPGQDVSPEEEQARMMQQAEAQDVQRRQVAAQLKLMEAKADEAVGRASKEQLKAINDKIQALQKSLEVALQAAQMPQLAPVADEIFREAQKVMPVINNVPVSDRQIHMEARAEGGPIQAGKPYLVGEQGPEIIVPETNGNVIPNYGARPDGTRKGNGWLGPIPMQDGSSRVMTELTSNFDGYDMPLIVPTLSKEEIDYLSRGNKATRSIMDKAYRHGMDRINMGLSPYAD